ncbi:MAG: FtsX-like permease family protein [Clostridiales bacterium]|nr:FtsX-like permease family protein [Clostridiales bacterium]
MKKSRRRDPRRLMIWRTIRGSVGRYVAIVAIIALGASMFSGLKVTTSAMIKTGDKYYREQSFYDFQLMSTLGITDEDIEAIGNIEGVSKAAGSLSVDFMFDTKDGTASVVRAHMLTDGVNDIKLHSGRMPESPNECLADAFLLGSDEGLIGSEIKVSENNKEDTLDLLKYDSYTIVGTAFSPLYINYERGTTAIGTGSVSSFLLIPRDGFDTDVFTEAYVKLSDDSPYLYSDEYEALADSFEPKLTQIMEERGVIRYDDIMAEANEEIADAEKELKDGWEEYYSEKADAEKELYDAKIELADARIEIDDGWKEYYDGLEEFESEKKKGENELYDAKRELEDAYQTLMDAEAEYEEGYQEYMDGQVDYAHGVTAYYSGLEQYEAGAKEFEAGKAQFDAYSKQLEEADKLLKESDKQLTQAEGLYSALQYNTSSWTNPMMIYAFDAAMDGLVGAGDYTITDENLGIFNSALGAARDEYNKGVKELEAGKAELDKNLETMKEAEGEIASAALGLEEGWEKLEDAKLQLADAKKEIEDGRKELDDGWQEYYDGLEEYEDGKKTFYEEINKARKELDDAYIELTDAEEEYADGLEEYEDGLKEFNEEIADAQKELYDGEQELSDAKKDIAEIEPASVYVLGRESNNGYSCFESDSQIVDGVARVFPIFFFLVAALVCMTTMTRMVDDDRTQIGVMKAIGYSGFDISKKYIIYAGSAALFGSVIGMILGSWLFPKVIWLAYKMMYGFGEIEFFFDWYLAVGVTLGYLACNIGATLMSCLGELRQVPAQLIRPKTPKAGKRIFMEYIPFIWNRMKFLHKVSFRNIFRYTKRLIMMLLGIGGCTALLVTGFGIGDSIKEFVNYQYDEISIYDCVVSFSEDMDDFERAYFLEENKGSISDAVFLHMSSVEIESDELVKSSYFCAVNDDLEGFMDFHNGSRKVEYPKDGGCIINIKIAQNFGLEKGDTIKVRDEDMNYLTLTVEDIYENYVFNYIYVTYDTLNSWNGSRDIQCAYVNFNENSEGSALASVTGSEKVAGVQSSLDIRTRLGNMLSSLDFIVVFITFCAGALAFIVLYNLTNINITERIREIATIKVLGFYPGETASYVFRENFVLSIMGAILGLPLGKLLHAYVMAQINIDMIHFDPRITAISFLMSAVFTLAFAGVVNFVMYFKLKKIDMAESLKSVE